MFPALFLEELVSDVVVQDGGVNVDQLELSVDALLPEKLADILVELLNLTQPRHEDQN